MNLSDEQFKICISLIVSENHDDIRLGVKILDGAILSEKQLCDISKVLYIFHTCTLEDYDSGKLHYLDFKNIYNEIHKDVKKLTGKTFRRYRDEN